MIGEYGIISNTVCLNTERNIGLLTDNKPPDLTVWSRRLTWGFVGTLIAGQGSITDALPLLECNS